MKKEPKNFYYTKEWRALRYQVLKYYGGRCQCCGSSGPLHVDHIKPRKYYPKLELEFSNLQVLCVDCNMGKMASDQTDWRKKQRTYRAINTKRVIAALDEFVWNGGKLRH